MAATITLDARPFDNISTHRVVFGTFSPGVYATGGVALTGGDLKNLKEIEKILFTPATESTPVAILLKYNATTLKVLAFDMTGAEVSNGTDLSAYSAGFVAFGA